MSTSQDLREDVVSTDAHRVRARWWLALIGGALLWHGFFLIQPSRLAWFGMASYPQFIDSLAVLSAGEAAQLGLDVYRPNPLDPYRRPHSYSSVWLLLGDLGLTRADNLWFALTLIALTVGAALWVLRPQTGREAIEGWLALAGPGVLLAFYRANNDLWVFVVLSLLVPCVLHRLRLARMAAPFVVAFATALKYYPLVAGVLMLAEPARRDRALRFGVLGMLLLMVGAGVWEDLQHLRTTQPVVGRFWSFGAALALRELGLAGSGVLIASVGAGGMLAVLAAIRPLTSTVADEDPWSAPAFLLFLLGGALLASCFWAGASWGYRWIFVVWLLPWFWQNRGSSTVLWRIVRGGWWVPYWFAPLFAWVTWATGIYARNFQNGAWWLSQAIEWLWFGALTAVIAQSVGLRVRRLWAAT